MHTKNPHPVLVLMLAATLATSLAFPSPVLAGEPPPPLAGEDDLGSQPQQTAPNREEVSSEVQAAPIQATTAQSDAAQLGAWGLLMANNVRFCPPGELFGGLCQNFTSIEDALAYARSLASGSGFIFVDGSYATSTPGVMLSIDENSFTGGADAVVALTLQGGVNWADGSLSGYTSLAQPLTVANFGDGVDPAAYSGGFSLRRFALSEGAGQSAVQILDSQNLTLHTLRVDESGDGEGILILNAQGVLISSVQVNESGAGDGIHMDEGGEVRLNFVSVQARGAGNGISILNTLASGMLYDLEINHASASAELGYGAFLAGNAGTLEVYGSDFNASALGGLSAVHSGGVLLDGVNAAGNAQDGMHVQATGQINLANSSALDNGGRGLVLVSDASVNLFNVSAEDNQASGLLVNAPGDIYADGVYVSWNGAAGFLAGASLDTCLSDGATCTGSGNITVTNSLDINEFAHNQGAGLQVTAGGDVLLERSDAFYNRLDGFLLTAQGAVISDSYAYRNGGSGHAVFSSGDILLAAAEGGGAAIDDNDNGAYGALLSAGGDVQVGFSVTQRNTLAGIRAQAGGGVIAQDIYSYDNLTAGASFEAADVEVSGGEFTGNQQAGLDVLAADDASLENITAMDNSVGAQVSAGGKAEIHDSLFQANQDGLLVWGGSVNLAQVDASQNAGLGAKLQGVDLVQVYGSSFGQNTNGLLVDSLGNAVLNGVTANENAEAGAQVKALGAVTVQNSLFNLNRNGLSIEAGGNARLTNVTASDNLVFGASILAGGAVQVAGGTFSGNQGAGSYGLGIFAGGNISLVDVQSDSNAGSGAVLEGASVQAEDSTFNRNRAYGLEMFAGLKGALIRVTACGNRLGGVEFDGPARFPWEVDTCAEPEEPGEVQLASTPAEWRFITIYTDANLGSGVHSNRYGLVYRYVRKMEGQAGIELARISLAAGLVPEGTTGTFKGLAVEDVPSGLPGAFGGTAFEFNLAEPGGAPIRSVAGVMQVRFRAAAGANYAILRYDETSAQWEELPTGFSGEYATAQSGQTGVFVLVSR